MVRARMKQLFLVTLCYVVGCLVSTLSWLEDAHVSGRSHSDWKTQASSQLSAAAASVAEGTKLESIALLDARRHHPSFPFARWRTKTVQSRAAPTAILERFPRNKQQLNPLPVRCDWHLASRTFYYALSILSNLNCRPAVREAEKTETVA